MIKKNTKNTFKETRNYLETDFLSDFLNKDDFKTIFKFKEPRKWDRPLVNENKVADVVADSNLWYANQNTKGGKALFCFVNSGTIRDCFGNTDVNFNDIKKIVPFTASTLIKTSLTKKQIIDTLNWCVESTRLPKISPGLMQVSGLTYKIDKNNKVKDVCVVDKFGNILENIDNAPNNKAYTCVYDNYLATGVANLKNLVKDVESADVECFDVSRQSALLAYLTAHNGGGDIWDINYPRIKAESV